MVIRDDTNLRLDPITIDTSDGQTWDGLALISKGGDPHRRRVAVIVVHGSVGNYITGVPRRVAHGLALAGFTVLSVNTRMANYGVFFGGWSSPPDAIRHGMAGSTSQSAWAIPTWCSWASAWVRRS